MSLVQKGGLKKKNNHWHGCNSLHQQISTHQNEGCTLAKGMHYYQHHPPPEISLCIIHCVQLLTI